MEYAMDGWIIPRVFHLSVFREDEWDGWTLQIFVGLIWRGRWNGRFISFPFAL